MSNLRSDIRTIVHEHSGGVKFLTLIAELDSRRIDIGFGPTSAEAIIAEIKDDPTLRIHEYMWHMSGPDGNVEGGLRAKMFVHQV